MSLARGQASILERIIASTREQLAERRRAVPLEALVAARLGVVQQPGRLREALARADEMAVVAEIKRRSPSAGVLREDLDVARIAGEYERGGAAAVSVLTEGPHFGGSLDDLRAARAACSLPILRKDFVIDRYQLHEAAAAGADAVLLIVAALCAAELSDLRGEAVALGLDALVEVHDARELEAALGAGADLIGVNNRDLHDFTVDVGRTFELMQAMPDGVVVVSESGIGTPEQMAALRAAGVAAVLVGESLMRAPQPEQALRALRAVAPVSADAGSRPRPGSGLGPVEGGENF